MDPENILEGEKLVSSLKDAPLELFLGSLNSTETRRQYKAKLELFFELIGLKGSVDENAKQFIEKARKDKQWAFEIIVRVVAHQKRRYDKKEITGGTLRNYYKPIKVFCDANDILLNWKIITRGMPKFRKFAQDRAPTSDEIRKLVEYPDRRIKPIVYVMCSSGIRVGAWDWLKWGHIEPVYKDKNEVIAAKMIVYAGEIEQYTTFITPEAYSSLKQWMDLREEHGEKIGPNSWVMRDLFRTALLKPTTHHGLASTPKKLTSAGIRSMLKRAWIAQGLIKESEGKEFEFKSSHGFRKRFKTQCELAGMKPLNVECLLGHDTGIAGSSYYRPTHQEMLDDYLKAIPALQISEVLQLKREMVEQEKRYQADMEKVQQQMARIQSQLSSLVVEGLLAKNAVSESSRPNQSHT